MLGEAWSDQKAAAWYFPDSSVAPQQLNKKCHGFSLSIILVNSVVVVKPVLPCDDLLSRYSLCEALAGLEQYTNKHKYLCSFSFVVALLFTVEIYKC